MVAARETNQHRTGNNIKLKFFDLAATKQLPKKPQVRNGGSTATKIADNQPIRPEVFSGCVVIG